MDRIYNLKHTKSKRQIKLWRYLQSFISRQMYSVFLKSSLQWVREEYRASVIATYIGFFI